MPPAELTTVIDREGAQATIQSACREEAMVVHGVSHKAAEEARLPSGSALGSIGPSAYGRRRLPCLLQLCAHRRPRLQRSTPRPADWETVGAMRPRGEASDARADRSEEVIDERLLRDQVHVRRVPIGHEVDGPMETRYEEDTLVIPVMREELVIGRRWILVEELHVSRLRREERDSERARVRNERLRIERLSGDGRD